MSAPRHLTARSAAAPSAPTPPLRIVELYVLAVGAFECDNEPGILFSTIRDPQRGVFLADNEARALRDWLFARYGAPESEP